MASVCSGKTSYRKISQSFEATRLDVKMIISFWNSTGVSIALLLRRQLNFRMIGEHSTYILRPRDFARFDGKMSCGLVNKSPGRAIDNSQCWLGSEPTSRAHYLCLSHPWWPNYCTISPQAWVATIKLSLTHHIERAAVHCFNILHRT